jgi:hypothetical protein
MSVPFLDRPPVSPAGRHVSSVAVIDFQVAADVAHAVKALRYAESRDRPWRA